MSMQWFGITNLPPGIDTILDATWLKYCHHVQTHTQHNQVCNMIHVSGDKCAYLILVHSGCYVYGSLITILSSHICQ